MVLRRLTGYVWFLQFNFVWSHLYLLVFKQMKIRLPHYLLTYWLPAPHVKIFSFESFSSFTSEKCVTKVISKSHAVLKYLVILLVEIVNRNINKIFYFRDFPHRPRRAIWRMERELICKACDTVTFTGLSDYVHQRLKCPALFFLGSWDWNEDLVLTRQVHVPLS